MKIDKVHLVFSGGKALPFIDPLRDQPKYGLTPAEYAEKKRQRTMRVCSKCGPTNNKFEPEKTYCVKCHSKQKLEAVHRRKQK